jgi:hypothetical protein
MHIPPQLKPACLRQQWSYVEEGGLATMPGSKAGDMAAAAACADMLTDPKL